MQTHVAVSCAHVDGSHYLVMVLYNWIESASFIIWSKMYPSFKEAFTQ